MITQLGIQSKESGQIDFKKLISVLTPWIQWFNMYALISGVTLGYALVIFIDLIYILFCKKERKRKIVFASKQSRWILYFMVVFTIMLPIGICFAESTSFILIANRFVKLYAVYIMIMFMNDKQGLDWKAYRRSLEVLVVFACVIIIYQFVSNMIFGYFYDIRIPFLKYAREDTNSLLTGLSSESRFRSIFTEPSYFVYFIFQYLPILLFDKYEERSLTYKEFLFAGVITICVVLSVSSTGLFLLALVWGIYFVTSFRQGHFTLRGFLIGIVGIMGLVTLAFFYLNNTTLKFSLQRMTSSYSRSSVVWWRFSAGYDNVAKMNSWQKIFGYGMGNFPNEDFMNGISYTILCTGIIGLAFVVFWMISNFINSKLCGKVATLIWILMIITEIMALYAPTLIGYAIMVNHYQKNKKLSDLKVLDK